MSVSTGLEFRLPTLPETQSITIAHWLAQTGEHVSANEKLLEVYSDKFDWDIPASADGTLVEVRAAAGTQANVAQVLAVIDTLASEEPAQLSPLSGPARPEQPIANPRFTPLAAVIAAEYQLDVAALAGSGVSGQVTKADVLAAIENRPGAMTASTRIPVVEPVVAIPVDAHSALSAPQASLFIAVDLANATRQRDLLQASWQRREGFSLDYLPFVLLAVVSALRDSAPINAVFGESGIQTRKMINLSLLPSDAQHAPVQVIPGAEAYNLVGMARALRNSSGRASDNRAAAATAGTFAVCDRSSGGALLSTGIIPLRHTALLTFGTVQPRTIVVDEELAIHPVVHLGLTFDRRLIDDFMADQYMGALKQHIETANFR